MNYFPLVSLLNIMLVGLLSSYTDLSRGKIYNKYIGPGFILGFLILGVYYTRGFGAAYLKVVLLNGAIAFIFSYLLWFCGKWSAGDAKLFSFFAFFLPFDYYRNSYVSFFPSINILLNGFVIIIAFMVLYSLYFMARKMFAGERVVDLKAVKLKGFFDFLKVMGAYVFIMYLISQLARLSFLTPIVTNNLTVFFAMFFLYGPLCKNKKIPAVLSVFALFILGYLFTVDKGTFHSLLYRAVLFVGLIGALRLFLDFYIKNKETTGVKVKDLRAGQILVESESSKVALCATQKDENCGYNETRSYGLNPSQIKIIRGLYKEEDSFLVYKTFPLGPLMFIGVLITILTSNSLVRICIEKLKAL